MSFPIHLWSWQNRRNDLSQQWQVNWQLELKRNCILIDQHKGLKNAEIYAVINTYEINVVIYQRL